MPSTAKAKSPIVAQLVRLARRERLSYDAFRYVCQQARQPLGLTKPQRARTLPYLLTADELTGFFRAGQDGGNVQHEILLQLLFFTAVRVGELVRIAVGAVDLAACKSFVDPGKGRQDRYILCPQALYHLRSVELG
jgi:integrase/recombinase XerD